MNTTFILLRHLHKLVETQHSFIELIAFPGGTYVERYFLLSKTNSFPLTHSDNIE